MEEKSFIRFSNQDQDKNGTAIFVNLKLIKELKSKHMLKQVCVVSVNFGVFNRALAPQF